MDHPQGADSGRDVRVDFDSRERLETDTLAMPENRAALAGLNVQWIDRFHGLRVRIDYVRPDRCATWGMWGFSPGTLWSSPEKTVKPKLYTGI